VYDLRVLVSVSDLSHLIFSSKSTSSLLGTNELLVGIQERITMSLRESNDFIVADNDYFL
jgi:hypothetical protein